MTGLPYSCFLPFDMDIKTLLDNLHEEVSCSVFVCASSQTQNSCLACTAFAFTA